MFYYYVVVHVIAIGCLFYIIRDWYAPFCKGCFNLRTQVKDQKREVYELTSKLNTSQRKLHEKVAGCVNVKKLQSDLNAYKKNYATLQNSLFEIYALNRLNTATQDELEDIYGVGPKYAKVLISKRPFGKIEEADNLIPGCRFRDIIYWGKSGEKK